MLDIETKARIDFAQSRAGLMARTIYALRILSEKIWCNESTGKPANAERIT
jgi:hypothetical protein